VKLEHAVADGVPGEAVDVMLDVKMPSWAKGKGYREAYVYMTLHEFREIRGGDMNRVGEWTVIFARSPATGAMIERHGLRPANRRTWAAMILTWMGSSKSVELVTLKAPIMAGMLGLDPSARKQWRFTRFDERGPVGHAEGDDPLALLEDAYGAGFRKIERGAVDRIMRI
jgi:hypothetical protein